MPYSPSAYVLTIIASLCGLWTGVLDFQKYDKAIRMLKIEFKKGIGSMIVKEDFLCYDTKFASRNGKNWLL